MYAEIPESVIEDVRKENNIVGVIEEYVQLKKQGRNYFGLCPFHNENSPSFSVTEEKQIFHCFGCGKGGNVITFLMEIENFTFIEAVRQLAERASITLPTQNLPKQTMSSESSKLLSAYEWLSKYYYHLLKYSEEGKAALSYLEERGIDEATIDQFQIGFAPLQSQVTIDFLKEKGFHEQFLVKNGLISTRDNEHFVDVFRGRVMIPIKNHLNRSVAFGGRAFQGEEPKYINSAEHELFRKGNILFNFNLAKNHIRKANEAIIFEGYMDVIAAHQAGIKNIIATLGTSLTANQAKMLARYVDTVVICYDGDQAGQAASYQAAQILQANQCQVKVARVKHGMDPDDYIKKYGGEKFRSDIIDTSDTFFKFYMNYKRREYNLSVDSERIAYVEHMIEKLSTVKSMVEREYYVQELASEFQLSTEMIQHDIDKYKSQNTKHYKEKQYQQPFQPSMAFKQKQTLPAYRNAERYLMATMFKHAFVIEKVQQTLGIHFNIEEHQVILTHLYALYEEKSTIEVSELIDKLDDPTLKKLVTEIAIMPISQDINEQEINDYIKIIQAEATEVTYLRSLKQKLQAEQNPILAAKIGLEIIEIEKQLKQM